MLSTLPVTLPNDGQFGNILHNFDSLWEYDQEPLFTFPPQNEPVESFFQYHEPLVSHVHQTPEPVLSNSPSENSNPALINPISSPDETMNQNHESPESGSDELIHLNRGTCTMDDRKERRKISNRESARRSRVRKQRHLENLRNQVTGLMMGNRELMNRLRFVTHNYQLARSENQRLRSESNILHQKLWEIRQVMLVRELLQVRPNNLTPSWHRDNVIINSMDGQQIMPQYSHR